MRSDPLRRLRAADWARGLGAGASGIGVVVWALGAIACALLPVPRALVDVLLGASLAGSAVLLAASVTARRSADLLWFPSLLLLAALSRLALNLTTTRMILADGEAGRVIEAFATLVIRGDLLVGAAMFAAVTVVQFVVIARGTERIAEVAARFALDGLPGQQAAIDADLRAGALSPAEAAERRARLLERTNLCASMDGASRYVRGDAVVGLVMVAINLVVGTGVGLARGLPVEEALGLYGRLTIGDGLASQVPALVASLAAAVLVARVEREEPAARAAGALPAAALALPAGLMALLALAPGMPAAAFGAAAAGLAAWALGLARAGAAGAGEDRRIEVCLRGQGPADIPALRGPLAVLRGRCADGLGIAVPEIVAVAAAEGDGPALEVRFAGRTLAVLEDMPGDVEALVVAVFRAVMQGAEALVDLEGLTAALEATRARRPATVREVLKVVGPAELLGLVRGLVRARVPVPELGAVLEAIAAEPLLRRPEERGRWVEALRERLAGYWVRGVVAAHARRGLRWVRPRPDAEAALLERVVAGEGPLGLRLSGPSRRAWLSRALAGREEGEPPPVVVCSPRALPAFALLLGRSSPHVTVLSTGELQAAEMPVPGEPGGPAASWFEAPGETARGLTLAGVAGEISAS